MHNTTEDYAIVMGFVVIAWLLSIVAYLRYRIICNRFNKRK